MTPQEQEQYDRIYCEVEDEARKEWVRLFGSARRFDPDSPALHRETERRIEQLAFAPRAVEMAYSLPIFEPQQLPRPTGWQVVIDLGRLYGMSHGEVLAMLAGFKFEEIENTAPPA